MLLKGQPLTARRPHTQVFLWTISRSIYEILHVNPETALLTIASQIQKKKKCLRTKMFIASLFMVEKGKNPNHQKPPNIRNRAERLSKPRSGYRSREAYKDHKTVWENGWVYLLSENKSRICRMIHSSAGWANKYLSKPWLCWRPLRLRARVPWEKRTGASDDHPRGVRALLAATVRDPGVREGPLVQPGGQELLKASCSRRAVRPTEGGAQRPQGRQVWPVVVVLGGHRARGRSGDMAEAVGPFPPARGAPRGPRGSGQIT